MKTKTETIYIRVEKELKEKAKKYALKNKTDLSKLINEQPVQWLGKEVAHKYNALPYLYKILDVHDMLSIQVHPSKQNAVLGFKAEQAKGIAIDAANRNYKDENHKPEIMVALSDFWLLHGFLPPAILEERLNTYLCLKPLMNEFRGCDYQNLYSFFMQLSMEASDSILKPLLKEASAAVAKGTVTKNDPTSDLCCDKIHIVFEDFNQNDKLQPYKKYKLTYYLIN